MDPVINFINENFESGSVSIIDFPLMPKGKVITDCNGDTMLVYLDILTNTVKWDFPKS